MANAEVLNTLVFNYLTQVTIVPMEAGTFTVTLKGPYFGIYCLLTWLDLSAKKILHAFFATLP